MPTEVLAHTIADACQISGIGRTTIYHLIGAGRLEARKVGNRTLVLANSLRALMGSLPPANIRTGKPKAKLTNAV